MTTVRPVGRRSFVKRDGREESIPIVRSMPSQWGSYLKGSWTEGNGAIDIHR
jgi:hypothetical protein